MTLEDFEEHGQSLQIRVTGMPEPIWFVPKEADVEGLAQRDIQRGRIWTARELRTLWGGGSEGMKNAVTLARIKIALDGELVSVGDMEGREGRPEGSDV